MYTERGYVIRGTITDKHTVLDGTHRHIVGCINTKVLHHLGGTNTMRMRILTVNGGTGDGNLNNNQVECTVTRLATAVNNDGVITDTPEVKFVEVRQFSQLYEKPIRYNNIDEAILEKGLNIIHIHYSDGTVEIRKISVN